MRFFVRYMILYKNDQSGRAFYVDSYEEAQEKLQTSIADTVKDMGQDFTHIDTTIVNLNY